MIEVLQELRDAASRSEMNQQRLAEATGISKGTISRILSGTTDNPTLQNVIELAAALGYDLRLVPEGELHEAESLEPETAELYRSGIAARDDRIALLEERMDARDASIQAKDTELHTLHSHSSRNARIVLALSVCVAVLTMLCIYLIADALNGGWGFFRR